MSAETGGCSSGLGLVPTNASVRHASTPGLIATTSGEIHRPPREYEVCFRGINGTTGTDPVLFTVL